MLLSGPQERKFSADINDIFPPTWTKTVAYVPVERCEDRKRILLFVKIHIPPHR